MGFYAVCVASAALLLTLLQGVKEGSPPKASHAGLGFSFQALTVARAARPCKSGIACGEEVQVRGSFSKGRREDPSAGGVPERRGSSFAFRGAPLIPETGATHQETVEGTR